MPQTAIFSLKPQKRLKIDIFRLKMQFEALRHFLDKSEEIRPPLKLKNNGGLLSSIFLYDAFEGYFVGLTQKGTIPDL